MQTPTAFLITLLLVASTLPAVLAAPIPAAPTTAPPAPANREDDIVTLPATPGADTPNTFEPGPVQAGNENKGKEVLERGQSVPEWFGGDKKKGGK
ncbi:hypothetical protein EPUS_03325 [Endocarpon pusillum Z07020]|uniref:Uncharacterized protein n=1 Tax=Endocarpon pusillum (strain Z07020 / HMAS-L-300199) TaxID=1263415 RepID=U1HL92_ENDPU|nr:uncharacterized protein EPUS_03325 [Endocarpon pusillum Z07020]ERF71045.1 hypothetical protein EPUS_03325 [Endocarpon pusillum Z07020]